MLLGMLIFALAPVDNPMPYMVVGRLLLGFGESLCASIAAMVGLSAPAAPPSCAPVTPSSAADSVWAVRVCGVWAGGLRGGC